MLVVDIVYEFIAYFFHSICFDDFQTHYFARIKFDCMR